MLRITPQSFRNESEVESKLVVQYLLPALGYTQDDWYQEVTFGSIRLDFLAFAVQALPFTLEANSPLSLIIEAKNPRVNLDKYVRRLNQYLVRLKVRFGVLTNGVSLRIYEENRGRADMIFQCGGEEIQNNIERIRSLIGKDVIKKKVSQTFPVSSTSTQSGKKSMKIISIYHNKGGVGKTTVAVNLAAGLRKRNYRVLLVDLDSQANSTFAAGLIKFQFDEEDTLKDNNVYHLLESAEFFKIPEVVRPSQFFNTPEIDVIPSHINLIEGQYKLRQIVAGLSRLSKKLEYEKENYDFVVIDTPPSRDFYAQIALIACDYLIIPSDLKPFANQGLLSVKSFIKECDEFRSNIGKKAITILGVLPSKISTNAQSLSKVFPQQKQAVLNKYQLPILDSIIFERVALSHCLNQTMMVGDLEMPDPRSIFEYAERHASANTSAEEFESLIKEILSKIGNPF